MPTSEASLAVLLPPSPPPPSLLLPPQAARVEATVAAARTVTRRREDLDNSSPLVRPGHRCPGVGGGMRSRGWRDGPVVLTPGSNGQLPASPGWSASGDGGC